MPSGYLIYQQSKIHYHVAGHGDKLLICLHGFGESANHFEFLTDTLKDHYTIISIDLPYHGKTIWKQKEAPDTLTISHWIENITREAGKDRFSLLGYSMGGRIAISITEHIPSKVDSLVLCAPDGLKWNFWYWLATQTWPGKKLFWFTMKYAGWFLGMIRLASKTKMINDSFARFTLHYLNDAAKRKQVYDIWMTLRRCRPDIPRVKSMLVYHHIRTQLVFGKFDRIITARSGYIFRRNIEGVCDLHLLDAGHQFMLSKHVKEITSSLLSIEES